MEELKSDAITYHLQFYVNIQMSGWKPVALRPDYQCPLVYCTLEFIRLNSPCTLKPQRFLIQLTWNITWNI